MGSPRDGRSSIVVPIRLPSALEAIRRDHVEDARLGAPAHVTLLFPFVPAADVDRWVVEKMAAVISRARAFDAAFHEVSSWPPSAAAPEGVVWLPPVPAAPFVELTAAFVDAFPGYPPYGGAHDEVIPHLTLANRGAHGRPLDIDALVAEAGSGLPFGRSVTVASLLLESAEGRWRTARRLFFGLPAAGGGGPKPPAARTIRSAPRRSAP